MEQPPVPAVAALLDFTGKVVLITGAGGGIGYGIATRFAEAGARVVVHYHTSAAPAEALAQLITAGGGQATALQADITNAQEVTHLIAQAVALTGDFQLAPGFNLNGIDATPNGKTLVTVQSGTGKLFTVTPAGVTTEIDLGGQTVQNGDGILLQGRTLYVVRNQNNQIAVVQLKKGLERGEVQRHLTDADLDVPTTIVFRNQFLFAVNARFTTPATPSTKYQVVKVHR